MTCLAPEPVAPLGRLTERFVRRFPEFPPGGGRSAAIVPHLTGAPGSASDGALAARALTEAMASSGLTRSGCRPVVLLERASGVGRTVDALRLANKAMHATCGDARA
jgi:hypothetical protein